VYLLSYLALVNNAIVLVQILKLLIWPSCSDRCSLWCLGLVLHVLAVVECCWRVFVCAIFFLLQI